MVKEWLAACYSAIAQGTLNIEIVRIMGRPYHIPTQAKTKLQYSPTCVHLGQHVDHSTRHSLAIKKITHFYVGGVLCTQKF